jgi:hypothetical protein
MSGKEDVEASQGKVQNKKRLKNWLKSALFKKATTKRKEIEMVNICDEYRNVVTPQEAKARSQFICEKESQFRDWRRIYGSRLRKNKEAVTATLSRKN